MASTAHQFRYFIIPADGGDVVATNDEKVAKAYSDDDMTIVIDSRDSKILMGAADPVTIEEQTFIQLG